MASLPMVASGGSGAYGMIQQSVNLTSSYQTFTITGMKNIFAIYANTSDNYNGIYMRNADDSTTFYLAGESSKRFSQYGNISTITDDTITIKWNASKGCNVYAFGELS